MRRRLLKKKKKKIHTVHVYVQSIQPNILTF